ncbi:MAG: type II toxin-antitoxin system VapC family toxin [Planctomycetes bacterium]|nr:type II toxin-antitoxin system VapC family toxin [Planctomycetota bacterium]
MTMFLDTSGLYAVADAGDRDHSRAVRAFEELRAAGETLRTTNYVVVELSALLASRLGLEAARWLHEDVEPILDVECVPSDVHRAAVGAFLATGRRRLSLVDCASFEVMRRAGIQTAFAVDKHFREQGFRTLP